MHILVAPDSFKGSLSAEKVGQVIQYALTEEIPGVTTDVIPMADGGEGTINTLLFSANGRKESLSVTGPNGEKKETYFGVLKHSKTAVMEVAEIAGFTCVPSHSREPYQLTTYGLGESIKHALDLGYRKFIIGLGGSATNDAGIGMLSALGVNFKDVNNNTLPPYPYSFKNICSVDYSQVDHRLQDAEIIVASDVDNPLCGKSGATYIFGPQKGVEESQLHTLDAEILHYATAIETALKRDYKNTPGAGAAGGLGFAMLTIGASMTSGAKLIAEELQLKSKIKKSHWVITGEGKTDHQTMQGKLPYVVASMARECNVPTILISGAIQGDMDILYKVFESVHAISSGPMTLEESLNQAEYLLEHQARNVARLLKNTKKQV